MTNPKLAIVVPCYNEEECIEKTSTRLNEVLQDLIARNVVSDESFIYLVNDGSKDKTWEIIQKLHSSNKFIKALKFTRNFGNQNAIIAGLTKANQNEMDCVITIDADLQQDETKIEEFVEKYKKGAEIVCGIRKDRDTDSFIKKFTAEAFYKVMNIMGVKIQKNHSEYRLVSKKALSILSRYKEVNMFLRGFFYELGLKTDYVYFDVKKRESGESKYNLYSLYGLALEGITSFSIVPLRMVTFTGLFIAVVSFILALQVVFERIFNSQLTPGWATIVFVISFLGGVQIMAIGVIGEYIGQLFREVKGRPRYIEDEELS